MSPVPDADALADELRIWWLRRNEPAPRVVCADGSERPRWDVRYCRRVVQSIVPNLRAARRRGAR